MLQAKTLLKPKEFGLTSVALGGKPKTDGVLAASAGAASHGANKKGTGCATSQQGSLSQPELCAHSTGGPVLGPYGAGIWPPWGRDLALTGLCPHGARPRRHFIAPWRALWGAAPGHGHPPTATPSRPQAHGQPNRATSPRPLGPGHPGPPQGRLRAPSPRTASHPPLGACPQARPLFTANSLHCS